MVVWYGMSVAACDLAVAAAGEAMLLELRARGGPAICLSVPDTQIDLHIRVPAADLQARGSIAPAKDLTAGAPPDSGGCAGVRRFPRMSAIMEVIEEILQGRGPRAPSDAGALAG
jgi:hypothetical protein